MILLLLIATSVALLALGFLVGWHCHRIRMGRKTIRLVFDGLPIGEIDVSPGADAVQTCDIEVSRGYVVQLGRPHHVGISSAAPQHNPPQQRKN